MPKVLIVAGEPSGDLHAAHIFQHIKKQRPDIGLYSAAGRQTAEYSTQIYDLVQIAAMGSSKSSAIYRLIFKLLASLSLSSAKKILTWLSSLIFRISISGWRNG